MNYIKIHPLDNVAVALKDMEKGATISDGGRDIILSEKVSRGHKISLSDIPAGSEVIKYGNPIAVSSCDIKAGEWVHTHNAKTGLSENDEFTYDHKIYPLPSVERRTFMGYRRKDGRVGIRNEIWIIPIVGCVNSVAGQLVRENQDLVKGTIDGLYTFPHPFGCSQLGDDLKQTGKLLTALVNHPNAGAVLVLGLGCENLTLPLFMEALGGYDPERVRFLITQEVSDEIAEGSRLLKELADYVSQFKREETDASELVVGMKCGGSDGLSGITANPAVGRFSDRLIAMGGSTVLTEVPEMFGAESILFERCESREVFDKAVRMIDDFKHYFTSHGQVVYENPSPGNKEGGITTLEDKSCGCVQKGGSAQIVDVLNYAEPVVRKGLNLLSGPGNDLVSSTDLTAAGAHLILFTTGRGTPFGAPAPTIKISTNTALFEKKNGWIDFNAGTAAEGESLDRTAERLLDYVLEVAGGKKTKAEERGFREISIFKDGVVL
ncbi:MAG: altronate dehydratase family protein [Lachnospiraceae bacterium]|nr:altronate dehydratase family protein [Lachnospiraceae bacterium]